MDKKPSGVGGLSKLNDYDIQTKLGQGSFGIVYKIKRKSRYLLKCLWWFRRSEDLRAEAD